MPHFACGLGRPMIQYVRHRHLIMTRKMALSPVTLLMGKTERCANSKSVRDPGSSKLEVEGDVKQVFTICIADEEIYSQYYSLVLVVRRKIYPQWEKIHKESHHPLRMA